jgi:hypothetical protein
MKGPVEISYNSWDLRQYFPTFLRASLYTGSVHPGVAQIPGMVKMTDETLVLMC